MPVLLRPTDSGVQVNEPEFDHRIEPGSIEYREYERKVPAVDAYEVPLSEPS
jgi:hypothetical protein